MLVAIAVHSLFYAAFFEDPLTWALLGLVGLVSRVPKKAPPRAAPVPGQATQPVPTPTPTL